MAVSAKRQQELLSLTPKPLLPSQEKYKALRHWTKTPLGPVKVPYPIYKLDVVPIGRYL
jgi:hypothetical protein